jgi:hypothetical protein
LRAEGDADSDFTSTLTYRVSNHSVETNNSE